MRAPFHAPLIIPLDGEYLGLSTDLRFAGKVAFRLPVPLQHRRSVRAVSQYRRRPARP